MFIMVACVATTFYFINSSQSASPLIKVEPVSSLETPEPPSPLEDDSQRAPTHPRAPGLEGAVSGPSSSVQAIASIATTTAQEYLRSLLPWIVGLWGVGVIILSMRLLGGWTYTRILVRSRSRVASEQWCDRVNVLRRDLGIDRTIQLLSGSTAATTSPSLEARTR